MRHISLAVFMTEIGERFGFLAGQYGMDGPSGSDSLLPVVRYGQPGMDVSVALDQGDGAGRRVRTSVGVHTGHGRIRAELPALVRAAVFAPAHHVAWKARTLGALRASLDDHATWLSRLMPELSGPGRDDLIRSAARPPGRSPAASRWKYPGGGSR